MAPPRITGYNIEKLLGRGGFASVYLATHDETGQQVALKVLYEHTTDEADLKRFERERMSLAALTGHPHIVDIVDFGETAQGHHFIALEYVEGGSIADRLRTTGAMHWADAARVGVHICAALNSAHRAGVLHRDVKPANILYGAGGAKLGDFGIARLVGQSQLTAAQSIIGTLAYTPPEVLHNRAFDGRGDIYQLGITLYEMLLGRAPFKSGSSDNKAIVIRRILDNPAPPLAQFDVPQPISDLLDQVLAKDPADRPQTAESFAAALNRAEVVLGQTPTLAGDETETLVRPAGRVAAAHGAGTVNRGGSAVPPTPTPPEIDAPSSDRTIVEPHRPDSTAIISDRQPPYGAQPPSGDGPDDRTVRPAAARPPDRRPNRRPAIVIGSLVVLALAIVGGIAALQLAGDDENPEGDADGSTTTVPDPTPDLEIQRTIERMEQEAFVLAETPHEVMFGAVANTQGLTAVGAIGTSDESASGQAASLWTMSPEEEWKFRAEFPTADGASNDAQRLRGIGVIDRENFLAVGDDGADGVAWLGANVDDMIPLVDETFTGPGNQKLVAAAGDPVKGEFLVAGAHSSGGPPTPGLWVLRPDPTWDEATWLLIPIRGQRSGEMTDVAIAGDEAVAVGWERADNGRPQGLVMIRDRDAAGPDTWVSLLGLLPDTQLNSVDFFGDRIVAVGTKTVNGVSRPVAVVVDTSGVGVVHELPVVGNRSGRANDVVETAAGVFAVGVTGEVDGDAALQTGRTDGALWAFVPGDDDEADDRWQTRETDELGEEGFQEFWSVVEYRGRVFALGRTDGDVEGETVAAAWTVTVDFGDDTTKSAEVVEAQGDAAPEELPESVEGDAELGLDVGGCAAQAVARVRELGNDPTIDLTPVFESATDNFAVWICEDDSGQLWYHGARRDNDPDFTITLPAQVAADNEGFVARNGDETTGVTEYRIANGRLTVIDPDGDISLDEPLRR